MPVICFSETKLEKDGVKGSKLEVILEYMALQSIEVSSRTEEEEFIEKYGVANPEDGGERTGSDCTRAGLVMWSELAFPANQHPESTTEENEVHIPLRTSWI